MTARRNHFPTAQVGVCDAWSAIVSDRLDQTKVRYGKKNELH
jgi:hypothetical protein